MHESKESMERFEFLERRNVLVLPGDAESARPIYVEVCDARQSIHSREILELSEEQTVFAERRLAQVSSLREIGRATRLNSSHGYISYAVFCLKKKKNTRHVR